MTQDKLTSYRDVFERRHNRGAVITDNELEEIVQAHEGNDRRILAEMYDRSKRNAESMASARVSYAGY